LREIWKRRASRRERRENKKNRGDEEGEAEGEEEFVMALGADSSGNGMAEGFGLAKPYFSRMLVPREI